MKKAARDNLDEISLIFERIRDLGRRIQGNSDAAAFFADGLRGCARAIEADLAAHSKSDSQSRLPPVNWNETASESPKLERMDHEPATESELDSRSEQSNSDVTTSRNASGASTPALNGHAYQASQNWLLWFSDFPAEQSELESARSLEREHAVVDQVGNSKLEFSNCTIEDAIRLRHWGMKGQS